jgi:uncharacterized protein (TIGR03000 family)
MYTAVLMMALTTSADTVDFGRRGGNGCSGAYSGCYGGGYYGGGGSGCYGGGYHGSGGHHGCCGHGGVGYGAGYHGSTFYGAGYHPAAPYFASGAITPTSNGYQSFYMNPNTNTASVRVLLPNESAEIWFDDNLTKQTGMERTFLTPALSPDSQYVYTVKARWNDNGQTINRQQRIELRAGQPVTVDFRNDSRENLPLPKGNNPPRNDG